MPYKWGRATTSTAALEIVTYSINGGATGLIGRADTQQVFPAGSSTPIAIGSNPGEATITSFGTPDTATTATTNSVQTPLLYSASVTGATRSATATDGAGQPDFAVGDRLQFLNGAWTNVSPGKGWVLENTPVAAQYSDPIATDTVEGTVYESLTTGELIELSEVKVFEEGDRTTPIRAYYLRGSAVYTPASTPTKTPEPINVGTPGMIAITDSVDASLNVPAFANYCEGVVKGSLDVIFTVDGVTPNTRNSHDTTIEGRSFSLDNRNEATGFRARTKPGTSKQFTFDATAVDVASNQINIPLHGLPHNGIIRFEAADLPDLPGGLSTTAARPYWVEVIDQNSFRLWIEEIPSDLSSGTTNLVTFTSQGTGTHTFSCIAIFCHSYEARF